VPLYTGTRQLANEVAAEASVDRARAQLSQTRKSAALEARQARLTLAQVEAALASLAETAGQATRAYEIAEVRFQEGLASQTELSDARIAEAQALSNRASAVRDLLVARVRLALLADLPLSATTSATGGLTNATSGSSTTTTSNSTQGASGGSTSTTSGTTTSTRTSTAGQTTP
jgi:outer membrane protein TolC